MLQSVMENTKYLGKLSVQQRYYCSVGKRITTHFYLCHKEDYWQFLHCLFFHILGHQS